MTHSTSWSPISQIFLALIIVLVFCPPTIANTLVHYSCCRYFADNGTQIDDFENLDNWSTNTIISPDRVNFTQGTQGIMLQANGSDKWMEKTININMSASRNIAFDMYVDNASNLTGITIFISNTSDYVTTFSQSTFFPTSGWNLIVLDNSLFSESGGDNWINQRTRIRFRVDTPSKPVNITFDNLVYNITGQANVIIGFDDGYMNTSTKAKPIMDANSQKGQLFAITGYVNTSPYVNWTSLRNMQNDNWSISSHTATHKDLTTLDQTNLTYELVTSQNTLIDNGFSKSASIIAYPNGKYDNNVISNVSQYYTLGRSYTSLNAAVQKHPKNDSINSKYQLEVFRVQAFTSTATVENAINNTINESGLITLVFHNILDAGASGCCEYLASDFQTISNYIASRNDIHVVTFSDYLIPDIPAYTPVLNKTVTIYPNGPVSFVTQNMYDEYTVNASIIPQSGSANVTVTTWNTTGNYTKNLTITGSNPNINFTMTVCDQPGNTFSNIALNGTFSQKIRANATGCTALNYTGGNVSNLVITFTSSCDWCKSTNVTIYANGSEKAHTQPDIVAEGNMTILFTQNGTNDYYTFNLTTDTITQRIFNESSNNASLGIQIIQTGLYNSTNYNIKIYNGSIVARQFSMVSSSTGTLQYNTSIFNGPRYTTIIAGPTPTPNIVYGALATIIIVGIAFILRRIKKV